jgi:hypothetical protein
MSEYPIDRAAKPRVLHLTLKKKWFDMIADGIKDEEYREIKDYWVNRLENKGYDVIQFKNGYSKDARKMTVELKGLSVGFGFPEWGAPLYKAVFKLKLGAILDD